jgi:hypothetical protein
MSGCVRVLAICVVLVTIVVAGAALGGNDHGSGSGAFVNAGLSTDTVRPTATSGFYDNFKADTSLNSNLWTTSGTVATTYGPYVSVPPAAIVTPVLTFGKGNGMQFSGVTGEYQVSIVQSVQSYAPPFYVSAEVNGSAVFGNAASLAIISADGSQSIGILGNLNASNQGYYGINSVAPLINRSGHGTIYASPQLDTWYGYNISVDSTGTASLEALSADGSILGNPSFSVGVGPFYIVIIEFEGFPAVAGSDFVNWSYASEGALASSGGSSGSGGSGFSTWWWVLVVIVVLVAFVVLVRIRRKRTGRAPLIHGSSSAPGTTQPPPGN